MTAGAAAMPTAGMDPRVSIPARPEPVAATIGQCALVVIDMQNGYLSPGGYLDRLGIDVSGSPPVINRAAQVLTAARRAGLMVVHVQNGWSEHLAEAGPPTSPMWHKSNPLKLMRADPSLKLLIRGSWDHAIVAPMAPLAHEPVVHKPRYSAFAGTNLEMLLRAHGITTLLFVGVNTNVCVETAVRDAFHREFFAVMVADATLQAGSRTVFEASVFNIETFFGWTSDTAAIVGWLDSLPAGAAGRAGAMPGAAAPRATRAPRDPGPTDFHEMNA
jgi:ureidoacrylate peracid hydrolase